MSHALQRPLRFRVEVDAGVELSVLDWGGSGRLVLLSHANGFCAALWRRVVDNLRGRYRVLAIDARGHGESSVPVGFESYRWSTLAQDIGQVARVAMQRTGDSRVALAVGHSFGGTCTLGAAADDPSLFERVLLLDPVIIPRARLQQAAGASAPRRNPMAEGARLRRSVFESRREALESWSQKPFFRSWEPEVLSDYVEQGLRDRADGKVELKCSPDTEATVFQAGATIDVYSSAPRVTAPVLFKWATGGNFSREVYAGLASLIPEARVEDAPTGHLIPMEAPAWVAQAIDGMLER